MDSASDNVSRQSNFKFNDNYGKESNLRPDVQKVDFNITTDVLKGKKNCVAEMYFLWETSLIFIKGNIF